MNTILAASLLTAIGVSICWLWVLRMFFKAWVEWAKRDEAIIAAHHADLMAERQKVRWLIERSKQDIDWWKDSQ